MNEMRMVFNVFDVDGSGTIQAEEVGRILRKQGLVTSTKMIEVWLLRCCCTHRARLSRSPPPRTSSLSGT